MFLKLGAVIFAMLGFSGCAATGDIYSDVLKKQVVVDATKGRLIFYRTTATIAAAGRAARITTDGENSKYVNYGGFAIHAADPGPHYLNVYMGENFVRCELRVLVTADEELFFEVKPNVDRIMGEAVAAGMSAGFQASGRYTATAYYAGKGYDEGMSNCQGYFSIAQVSRENALKELVSIRESAQ